MLRVKPPFIQPGKVWQWGTIDHSVTLTDALFASLLSAISQELQEQVQTHG